MHRTISDGGDPEYYFKPADLVQLDGVEIWYSSVNDGGYITQFHGEARVLEATSPGSSYIRNKLPFSSVHSIDVGEDATAVAVNATYAQHDNGGRVQAIASHTAIAGYISELAGLVGGLKNDPTGLTSTPITRWIYEDRGRIDVYTYGTSTAAPESAADDLLDENDDPLDGNADGYRKSISKRNGWSGTNIPIVSYTYYNHEAGNTSTYPVATRMTTGTSTPTEPWARPKGRKRGSPTITSTTAVATRSVSSVS